MLCLLHMQQTIREHLIAASTSLEMKCIGDGQGLLAQSVEQVFLWVDSVIAITEGFCRTRRL